MAAARAWLTTCQQDHRRCAALATDPRLPTRVLDVGPGDGSPSVRLCVPAEDQRGPYLALSYCWGGPQPLVTTTGNLEAMRSGVSEATLPQTLQDAVRVTRRLGLRFLWIDALCILQDSDEDKGREIGRMGRIYKSATATIIAGGSKAASEGFLRNLAGETPSCEVTLTLGGKTGVVSIAGWRRSALRGLPLSRRAWCFQEYALSGRHLFYTDHELVWQCLAVPHATVTAGAIQYAQKADEDPFGVLELPELASPGAREPGARHVMWHGLLAAYTRRDMTDANDRLNAITGVIEELKVRWEDECIFGIWGSRLVEELAWYTQKPGQRRSSRAPSWSWASTDAPSEITQSFLEKPLSAEPVSISEDRLHVSLEGALLSPNDVPAYLDSDAEYDGCQDWGSLELDTQEPCGTPMLSFFMLGKDDTDDVIALALIPLKGRRYRRVGLATFSRSQDEEAWALWHAKKRVRVTLV